MPSRSPEQLARKNTHRHFKAERRWARGLAQVNLSVSRSACDISCDDLSHAIEGLYRTVVA
jgi:hypothetical protein